jgi:hypothetical protein
VEIYIASFAALLSILLLAVVYLADRYEREPIELIQDSFLSGLLGQLVLILAAAATIGDVFWSGSFVLVTMICASIYLPFRLHRQAEVDERFDGIVYTVAFVGGATCVIHLNNLPQVIAASPYRGVIAPGASPDLRDLLIIATWPGFTAEFGQGLVLILAAVLVGAALATLQLRGWPPWQIALVCVAVALATAGLDLVTGGAWPVRGVMLVTSFAVALSIKRRSVFRDRPEPPERDVLIIGLKTALMVLGAALLTTVLLQAVIEPPEAPEPTLTGHEISQSLQPETDS